MVEAGSPCASSLPSLSEILKERVWSRILSKGLLLHWRASLESVYSRLARRHAVDCHAKMLVGRGGAIMMA